MRKIPWTRKTPRGASQRQPESAANPNVYSVITIRPLGDWLLINPHQLIAPRRALNKVLGVKRLHVGHLQELTNSTLQCKVHCMKPQTSACSGIAIGALAGATIAAVDNLAFGGEVRPIVIVGMVLIFSSAAGTLWGSRAAVPVTIAWAFLPVVHLVKHVLAMPDTIHPNTYASILKLGAFSFAISAIGLGFGLALHRVFGLQSSSKT